MNLAGGKNSRRSRSYRHLEALVNFNGRGGSLCLEPSGIDKRDPKSPTIVVGNPSFIKPVQPGATNDPSSSLRNKETLATDLKPLHFEDIVGKQSEAQLTIQAAAKRSKAEKHNQPEPKSGSKSPTYVEVSKTSQ